MKTTQLLTNEEMQGFIQEHGIKPLLTFLMEKNPEIVYGVSIVVFDPTTGDGHARMGNFHPGETAAVMQAHGKRVLKQMKRGLYQ